MIKGPHDNAYRCRDLEEKRKVYEDFLGLLLVNAFKIETTQTCRRPAWACCTPSSSSTMARASPSSRRPTCRSSSRRARLRPEHRARGRARRARQMFARARRRPRSARRERPEVHPLDLLPLSERLRHRADGRVPGMERDMDPSRTTRAKS